MTTDAHPAAEPEADAAGTAVEAAAVADRVAARAGVRIRELRGSDEEALALGLLNRIWGRSRQNPILPGEFMRALGKAGSYIAGAFVEDRIVGASLGLHSSPERRTLHSHIAGVSPEMTGRAVGHALKLHQRAWALNRGIDAIEWTYDPLISRNANFNLTKLGARPVEYLEDFYGQVSDAVNAGDQSDRLLVRWELAAPMVGELAVGAGPLPPGIGSDGPVVRIPEDIEAIRSANPELAREWRRRVRREFTGLLSTGGICAGFERGVGYRFLPAPGEEASHEGEHA